MKGPGRVLEAELRSIAYSIVAKLEQLGQLECDTALYYRDKMANELVEIIDPRVRERRLLEEQRALAVLEKEMLE